MLFPVGHDGNVTVRRWPIVTVAIIFINLVAFLLTNSTIQNEASDPRLAEVRAHILILSARFPELPMSDGAKEMVENFKRDNPKDYERLGSPTRDVVDAWEARLMINPDWKMEDLAAEMAELCRQWDEGPNRSFVWDYAYHSEKPTPWSYVSYAFLHDGWLHLIVNMWMLYLVSALLEDAWGYLIYPIFYLAAAAAAAVGHGFMNPHSPAAMIGASGAVAGAMGAFLVCFPKSKIRMGMWFIVRPTKMWFFTVPAYAFLIFWVLTEILMAIFFRIDFVAHWAHVSGFAFGVVAALVLKAVKVEKAVNPEDPAKTWEPDERIVEAMEMLNQRRPDDALQLVQQLLAEDPNSIDNHDVLLKVQSWKGDLEGQRNTLATLMTLQMKAGNPDAAWQAYEQFQRAGGMKPPHGTWYWLIRYLERQGKWDQAAAEYEHLAAQYAMERVAIDATISAARIHLSKLNHVTEAERLYRNAANSPVPHLDMEGVISEGLKQCAAAKVARGVGTV